MNAIKKFMVVLFLSVVFCVDNAHSTDQPRTGTVGRLEKVKGSKTHRAPSNVFIEYVYTGNGFSFLSSDVYESLSVTVTNEDTADSWWSILSASEGYSIEMGELSIGTYSICATTETGVAFYGEFEVTN